MEFTRGFFHFSLAFLGQRSVYTTREQTPRAFVCVYALGGGDVSDVRPWVCYRA